MRALTVALLALALGGCHQGNGLEQPDLNPPPDLRPIPDLLPPADLTPGPTCGQIVLCAIQSGTTNPAGALGCFGGASPQSTQQAGALVLCAFTNCLAGGDGGIAGGLGGLGGAGGLQLLQCLSGKCQMQLSACQGLSGIP
jgi:hypothetical protein